MPANGGAVNHRAPDLAGGVASQELGRKIVGAFNQHVRLADEQGGVFGNEACLTRDNPVSSFCDQHVARSFDLRFPYVVWPIQDLAMQVFELNYVFIDE